VGLTYAENSSEPVAAGLCAFVVPPNAHHAAAATKIPVSFLMESIVAVSATPGACRFHREFVSAIALLIVESEQAVGHFDRGPLRDCFLVWIARRLESPRLHFFDRALVQAKT